jgi:hypothetical protein
MTAIAALPLPPVDPGLAAWLAPVFVIMALTGVVVLIWQAVRYFRDNKE